MASGGFDIAKAGWLYRQSSVLRRWKKSWFVLDRNGELRYFESPDTPRAEERLVVQAVVAQIKTGPECRKADPPEGVSSVKAFFIELMMKHSESLLLCAESMDDMKAWQISLEEARSLRMPAYRPGMASTNITTTTVISPPGYLPYNTTYAPYGGYPGQVIQPPPPQVIHHPGGTTTIVNSNPGQQIVYVDDGPYRRHRYYRGGIYPVPFFFW